MDATLLTETLQYAGLALFAVAAAQDLAVRLVPNRIPVAIAAIGFSVRVIEGDPLTGMAAAAAVFFAAALLWRGGWLGGADVKLFGAGALLLPPGAAFAFVLATCLAGGVLAIGYWLAGCLTPPPGPRPAGLLRRLARIERRRLRRGGPLPYAMAITAGACFILTRT